MKRVQHTPSILDIDNTPRWIVILMDIFITFLALLLAYLIRFDFYTNAETIAKEWIYIKNVLPFVILLKPVVFYIFQIHKVKHAKAFEKSCKYT